MKRVALPLGQRVKTGQWNGRTVWERRIRESRGETQIHLRFFVFEGGDSLNGLLEQLMERYYNFALKQANKPRPLSAVMRWHWQEVNGRVQLTLVGYTGPAEGYAPTERLRLLFFCEDTMALDRRAKKKPKKVTRRRKPQTGVDKRGED